MLSCYINDCPIDGFSSDIFGGTFPTFPAFYTGYWLLLIPSASILSFAEARANAPFFFYKYNCHSVISTAKDWQAISVGWDVQHIFQLQAACVAITSWFQLNYHLRDCSQFGAPTACMLSQWTMHGMVRLFWPYSAVSQSSSLCVFMPHVIGVVAQIGIVLVTGLILLVSTPLPSHEDHRY